MRTYQPNFAEADISRERYRELLAFCRQYPEWLHKAQSSTVIGAQQYSVQPHGNDVGDPVLRAVIKRDQLLAKAQIVERIAEAVDGGQWREALLLNVCQGVPLRCIGQVILPTAKRNTFYKQRRQFFILLDARLNEIGYSGGST